MKVVAVNLHKNMNKFSELDTSYSEKELQVHQTTDRV